MLRVTRSRIDLRQDNLAEQDVLGNHDEDIRHRDRLPESSPLVNRTRSCIVAWIWAGVMKNEEDNVHAYEP